MVLSDKQAQALRDLTQQLEIEAALASQAAEMGRREAQRLQDVLVASRLKAERYREVLRRHGVL